MNTYVKDAHFTLLLSEASVLQIFFMKKKEKRISFKGLIFSINLSNLFGQSQQMQTMKSANERKESTCGRR